MNNDKHSDVDLTLLLCSCISDYSLYRYSHRNAVQLYFSKHKKNMDKSIQRGIVQFLIRSNRNRLFSVEGQLELLPPIRQDGDTPRKLYAVPNKQTKPLFSVSLLSALNLFIHYALQSTIVLHLKVNIHNMNNRRVNGKSLLIQTEFKVIM